MLMFRCIKNSIAMISLCMAVAGYAEMPTGFYITAEGGWGIPIQSSQTMTASMPNGALPLTQDNYVSTHLSQTGFGGAGIGYQYPHPDWAPASWLPGYRLGLLYDYFTNSAVDGYVAKYQLVQAYDTQYEINSQVFWIDSQADLITWHAFTPFVELAVGAAFNNSHGYTETAVSTQTRTSADFGNDTVMQVAYMLGTGVNYELQWRQHLIDIGLGYRFADLGNAETGASATYPTVSRGLLQPLKTSEVLLSLRTTL